METPQVETDEEIEKPIDDNQKFENQIDNLITTNSTYCFSKIFIIFIIQTIIQTVFCKIKFFISEDIRTYLWMIGFFGLLTSVVFFLIREGFNIESNSIRCAISIFILLCVYKILFFIIIYYIVDYFKIKHFYRVNEDDLDNETIFGNFDFANLAIVVFYLALIIFTLCKNQINLLIYFIIGFIITLTMFLSLLYIHVLFGAYTAGLIFLEIAIFLLVAKISTSKNKLEENNLFNNIFIIDSYKYYAIMMTFYAIFVALSYIFWYLLMCLGTCCSGFVSALNGDNNNNNNRNAYDENEEDLHHYTKKS